MILKIIGVIMNSQSVDRSLFVIANLTNLLLTCIFRVYALKKAEYVSGLVIIFFSIPILIAAVYNYSHAREWWTYILPMFLFLFLLVELLLDYILKIDFRDTALLWPYLLVYYLGLMGMIGYSFLINKVYGFITLTTYFINLAATFFSYSKIGHN